MQLAPASAGRHLTTFKCGKARNRYQARKKASKQGQDKLWLRWRFARKTTSWLEHYKSIDPIHKWLPIKTSFVNINLAQLTSFLSDNSKEFLLSNKVSWANLNTYKTIFNRQPFMHHVGAIIKRNRRKTNAKYLRQVFDNNIRVENRTSTLTSLPFLHVIR